MERQGHYLPGYQGPKFPAGLVWLAGAGPGTPGLLTLEALWALQRADIIVYDALVDPEILEWRAAGAVTEYAGKRGGKPSIKQRDISLRLIELSRAGKRVLRLKGGDPFVFGRGGEEAQTLVAAGVPLRVTPGISAGIGGLAAAGIPLTHRDINQAVTIVTGHDQNGKTPSAIDWPALAKGSPVIVMYMAMKHLPEITAQLLKAGRAPSEPLAIVSNATRADMRILETTLAEAAQAAAAEQMSAPAIICLGQVVALRQMIDWAGQLRGEAPRSYDPLGHGRVADAS
ncbi:MAG: uroporphyrinogen-III C-methyltransferase [Pseudomonadota bacterium]